MPKQTADLRTLLQRRKPGYSLEAPFYTDPAVFEQDIKLIFGQHWIYAGPEAALPEDGDYITIEVGTTSVLIVRDADMNINAFHNVCRHRGSRLCNEHKGA